MLSEDTGYKKLILYKKAKELVLLIYKISTRFPSTEIYSLVPQMRRAAISVLANVVEGYSRESSAEYARFLTISIGSLTELELYLDLSLELGFVEKDNHEKASGLLTEVKKLLYVSRTTIRSKGVKK